MVNTIAGATGTTAYAQCKRRDEREEKETRRKLLASLQKEQKTITETVAFFHNLMKENPNTYFQVNQTCNQQRLKALLRLLAPKSGMLAKKVEEQRGYLVKNCAHDLNQESIIVQIRKQEQRLEEIIREIEWIAQQEDQQEQQQQPQQVSKTNNTNVQENGIVSDRPTN